MSADAVRRAGHELIDRRGWYVFLVQVTGGKKVPYGNCAACPPHGASHDAERCDHLLCHGFYAATRDHARFDLMCDERPDGVLAVRTGHASGIIVIDAEDHADAEGDLTGVETLEHWEELFDWSLPPTLRQRTSSGGIHLVYAYPTHVPLRSHNRALPAVDVKGEPGYVVVPPAPGRRWLDPAADVTPLSAELLAWLQSIRGRGGVRRTHTRDGAVVDDAGAPGIKPSGYDFRRFLAEGAPVGCRDEFFNDYAYRLRRRGVDHATATARLTEAWERADKTSGPPCVLRDALEKVDRVWETVEPEDAPLVMAPYEPPSPPDVDVTTRANGAHPPVVVEHRIENATDMGNSLRYARLLADRVRYAADEGRWYVWDDLRWVPDVRGLTALDLTKVVIDDLYRTTESTFGDDQRTWSRWSNTSESITRRRAMLDGAAAESVLRTTTDAFDRDPWLLVCRNGTLDLRACVTRGDCAVRESRREDLCTRLADVDHVPDASDDRWRAHVETVTQGDVVLAAYLRRLVGYSLTGDTSAQAFFFLEGTGANGKNAFIEPVVQLMGSYAAVGTSALLTGGDEQHPTILADLLGVRLVFIDETRKGRALNVERVKSLTGSQKIKARRMREDFFEFDARLKLWIAGNDHPTIRDPSDGVWRRMHRIMCNAKIESDRLIPDYGRLLYDEEASGILNWAVEGLRDYVTLSGLGPPAAVGEAVDEYRDEEDFVGQFLDECCELTGDAGDEMPVNALYAAFVMWCAVAGIGGRDRPIRKQFGRQVTARCGTKLVKWNRRVDGAMTRGYGGIKIHNG